MHGERSAKCTIGSNIFDHSKIVYIRPSRLILPPAFKRHLHGGVFLGIMSDMSWEESKSY